jgi:hypothetical protein
MSRAGFEPAIPMFEWLKTVLALDHATVETGIGKLLSDKFPIQNGLKQGDALSPLLFSFSLEFAVR